MLTDSGETAAHLAVRGSCREALDILLENKADYTIKNKHNQTAAQLAVDQEQLNCLEVGEMS